MANEARVRFTLQVGAETMGGVTPVENGVVFHVDPITGGISETGSEASVADLPKVDSDSPAYIFFTSGTTGIPKGILGSHKGLAHFINWQREAFEIGPQDRVAQLNFALLRPLSARCVPAVDERRRCLLARGRRPHAGRERVRLAETRRRHRPAYGSNASPCLAGRADPEKLNWKNCDGFSSLESR